MKNGLSNKQFIIIALIIMLCGIAIFSHDYFIAKKNKAMENLIVNFEEDSDPEVVDIVESNAIPTETATLDNTISEQTPVQTTSNNVTSVQGDTSGRTIKKSNKIFNYVGRIKIPTIGLNKGFVEAPSNKKGIRGCVDQNVCSYSGSSNYPSSNPSHLILGAHSGNGWNAFFTRIDKLKKGSYAYIEYKGKRYKYKLVDSYKDGKGDWAIKFKNNGSSKQLSLFTCARPNYNKYYLILNYKLVAEENIKK